MVKTGETYPIQPAKHGVVLTAHVERVVLEDYELCVVWHEADGPQQRTSLASFERWRARARACDQGYRLTLTEDQMRRIGLAGWTGGEAVLAEWLASAAEGRNVWRLTARLAARPAQADPIPDPGPRDPVTDPQRGDVVRTWLGQVKVFARAGDRVVVDTAGGLRTWPLTGWASEVEEVVTVGGAS
jgi:hypothetical protein